MQLRAVLFDVDFTLARPGPELGPDGYRRLGLRFGLDLDSERYGEARDAAILTLKRHPELEHDDEVWVAFTAEIIRGMGGAGDRVEECAREMTSAWEHAHNFELYDDALPVLAQLRRHGLKLGLVSNTARDLPRFVAHHGIEVDAMLASGAYGKTKPHPAIFRALLELLDVPAAAAVMVGDSIDDDIEGARAVGLAAFLLDRDDRLPGFSPRLLTLAALPAALGLSPPAS
jgi:HAD superfamily hydrolase (TIGR01549 family)